jgi:uncharacterized protein YlzI (FlbEa/FlbD family)
MIKLHDMRNNDKKFYLNENQINTMYPIPNYTVIDGKIAEDGTYSTIITCVNDEQFHVPESISKIITLINSNPIM